MKLPNIKKILKLYPNSTEKFVVNLENYLDNDDKVSELKYYLCSRKIDLLSILLEEHKDEKLLLRRLKRNKKQTITLCLELLSMKFDEEIRNLMRTMSNKRHTWKIVQDKKLEYSWDFIESIFN
jgi:hypothetical protein